MQFIKVENNNWPFPESAVNYTELEGTMVIFDTVRESRLRAFWPGLEPLRVLAREWSCSDAYISQQAKRLGLPSRKNRMVEIRREAHQDRFAGRVQSRQYFEREAMRRGMTPERLERVIIGIVSLDKLIGAILDDEEELRRNAA